MEEGEEEGANRDTEGELEMKTCQKMLSYRERERERDLGKCSSADAKVVKCCSERKIERVKGQRETQRMIHRVRPVELLPEGVPRCLPAPPASPTASLSSPPTAIYNLCKPVTSALNEARKRLQVLWVFSASRGKLQSQ